ncbi:flagellar export chaperone FliS [Phosphitispora sp. TUW77]|uniref:flagellar export chaperone FliS n=1 Tax=Phosphitispora sp. TUW77 TaxID=3152361 RepID=UPI003AB110D8
MQGNPYNAYKQTSVETASPERLVIMLYDGALKFLRIAREAIEQKNIEEANKYICKTQDIINEFIVSLNMSTGEIAFNLRDIYDFWNRMLIEANIKKDPMIIDQVAQQVQEMRDAWAEAAIKCKSSQPTTAVGGVNIEG